jgi:hypothetical protein
LSCSVLFVRCVTNITHLVAQSNIHLLAVGLSVKNWVSVCLGSWQIKMSAGTTFLPSDSREESTAKLIQGAGRIHFLEVARLWTLAPFCSLVDDLLAARGHRYT